MAQPTSPHVVVIGATPQTIERLQSYFVGVGIPTESSRTLDATLALPEQVTAVVVFPDGFGEGDVIKRTAALRKGSRRVLLVLVTSQPQRFSALLSSSRGSSSLLVLPKPVFGWAIVDAIRHHSETTLS